ncbi:hypothetical protein [Paenibacillus polymyxa]|uniref:hypothetical protein n=1 Tax=Paenibacillus polymyxa TaxID=1406 RepID=UPI00287FE415|nr:hypothetical protein [Paenibacillus polymyxa]
MNMLSIEAELPALDDIIARLSNGQRLPYTRTAVQAATTELVQATWIQYASGAQVSFSGGNFRVGVQTGDYVRSIQDGLRFPDDLTGEVFTTSAHGAAIESGQDARDLKPSLLASPKAKTGANGKKYITVPFRHGTPGAATMPTMPKSIYTQARSLSFSRVLSPLPTRSYSWGGRIKEDDTGKRSHVGEHPGAGYTWKAGKYQGLVKMGQPGHTQYLTFRRLSENSSKKSWMRPAIKPKPIRQAVIENTREQVQDMIVQGFQQDLAAMGLGGD